MSYNFYNNIKAKTISYGGVRNASAIRYIIIHYTGNLTDKAVNNAKFFRDTNTREAGAHYFADETSVYQSIDDLRVAYSVGGAKYSNCSITGGGSMYGKITNANSISIEMCSTNGKISDKTLENVVALAKQLMKKYNIPVSNVYRHFDVNGKPCPGWNGWGSGGETATLWNAFKKKLGANVATTTSKKVTKPDIIYRVYTNKWLPEVKNNSDYAGIEKSAIKGFMIKASNGSKIFYRVHIKSGKWYPWVTGYDTKDFNNGYAGDCKNEIDAIEIKCADLNICYKVSPIDSTSYYSSVTDGSGSYAGKYKKTIDKVMCWIS